MKMPKRLLSVSFALLLSLNLNTGINTKSNLYDLFVITASAQDLSQAKEVSLNTKDKSTSWNLKDLYKSDDDWKRELSFLERDINEYQKAVSKATKSSKKLTDILNSKQKIEIKIKKLGAYVNLSNDLNKTSHKYLDMRNSLMTSITPYVNSSSTLRNNIINLSDKNFNKLLKDKNLSNDYKEYLKAIKNSKSHCLNQDCENMLINVSSLTTLPRNVYEIFMNMDRKLDLTKEEYVKTSKLGTEKLKDLYYQKEFESYNDNINTLAALLEGQVKKNAFYAKERNYNSSLEMSLSSDNIDVDVYNNLIETVSKNTDLLHRYTTLRKNVLKVDKLKFRNTKDPIVKYKEKKLTYQNGKNMILDALTPLGKDYKNVLYKSFSENWIDVYPSSSKVTNAYCLNVYDSHPYILVNYKNDISSVSTLAHELGHGVYGHLSATNLDFYDSSPSIFTQEIASTTNEVLLFEHLIKTSKSKEEKAYYITEYLDFIRGTLFVQTMYAEFEKIIHDLVESGQSLNAKLLNNIWGKLLVKYNGRDYQVCNMDTISWAKIPHFYNSFYVYQYATGCSTSISFADEILNKGPKNYINFLKQGGTNPPLETLKSSGVNLNSNKPVKNALNKFEELLDELESLI